MCFSLSTRIYLDMDMDSRRPGSTGFRAWTAPPLLMLGVGQLSPAKERQQLAEWYL